MELTPDIRQRLKAAMENKKETGYTINAKLGISATTIGNYLNGKITNADNTKLKVICDLLGITLEWLQYGQNIVKSPDTIPSKENLPHIDSQEMLEQILLRFHSHEEQLIYIRHKLENILKEVKDLKQDTPKKKE